MKKCLVCGQVSGIKDSHKFCHNCGSDYFEVRRTITTRGGVEINGNSDNVVEGNLNGMGRPVPPPQRPNRTGKARMKRRISVKTDGKEDLTNLFKTLELLSDKLKEVNSLFNELTSRDLLEVNIEFEID